MKHKPSKVQIRALAIIEKSPGIFPGDFARALWDVTSWEPHTVGKTGGAYLWRLRVMGLVTAATTLTEEGKQRLEASRSR